MATSTEAAGPVEPEVQLGFQRVITEGRKPQQRGGHAALLIQDKLLVFGGHRYEKNSVFTYFNDVFVMDLNTHVWKEVHCRGATILPRYGHSCTLAGSRVFLFGGRGEEGMLFRDIHVLETKSWTWAPITSQSVGPSPRLNHASLLVGRKIVIHGGWDGKGATLGDLWVFDTENFAWLQPRIAGLSPSPRYGHTLNLMDDGRILLFGGAGMSAQGVPEYYGDLRELDTETMIWSRSRYSGSAPSARYGHTGAVVGGQLIIYGGWGVGGLQTRGENSRAGAESVVVLDTERGVWHLPAWAGGEPMPHKYGHSCSVDEGGAMVIFGGWDGKQAMNDVLVMHLLSAPPSRNNDP